MSALVLGIGNILMGDEGVGSRAVDALAGEPWLDGVALLDGGTGGFHLLSEFRAADPIVLIDATMDGQPPGTVTVTRPRYASDFPRALTAHDIGLRDLIEAAVLLGPLPELHLVTVSIATIRPMVAELSPSVAAALPGVRQAVRRALHQISGIEAAPCMN